MDDQPIRATLHGQNWWAVARDITDVVLGPGAYADANRGHPDPRVQEQVEISDLNRAVTDE
jgi:hypothetical protein